MAFKFIAVLAFVTIASAGYIQPQQQQFYQAAPAEHTALLAPPHHHHELESKNVEEYDPNPQYKFAYNVDDSVTGDSHSHSETRNGDAVEGEYSLIDADGYKRIVHYTADSEHGFNAVVSRVPLHGADNHDTAVKNSHLAYAAPIVAKIHYNAQAPAVHVASGSPSYYKPEAISYAAAPTALKTAGPVLYSAPNQYQSAPVAHIHSTPYIQTHASNSAPSAFVANSPSHSSQYHH